MNGTEQVAAQGEKNVTVAAGSFASVNIEISASLSGANGSFYYAVNFPAEKADTATLTIASFGGGGAPQTVNLKNTASGRISLSPGYYLMTIQLTNDMETAGWAEIVHIYANMETSAVYTLTDADFVKAITMSGTINVTVNSAAPTATVIKAYFLDHNNQPFYVGQATVTSGAWSIKVPAFNANTNLYFNVTATAAVGTVSADAGVVTVKDTDKSGIALGSINIARIPVTGVRLNKTALTLYENTQTLTATVQPANATTKNVTWSSSNTALATVDSNGLVTPKATSGTVTITVTAEDGGKTATCSVTLKSIAQRPDAQANKNDVLRNLGFSTASPGYPSSTPYGNGTIALNSYHELYMSQQVSGSEDRLVFDYKKDTGMGVYGESLIQKKYKVSGYTDSLSGFYHRSAGGDFLGTGKKEWVARIALGGDKKGGRLSLDVIEAKSGKKYANATPSMIYNFKDSQDGELRPWEINSFLSIVAADFDGDGKDEIAVHKGDGGYSANLIIFYKFNGSSLTKIGQLNLGIPNDRLDENKKNHLAVSLAAGDLNNDGKADLVVMAGFHRNSNMRSAANAASRLLIYHSTSSGSAISMNLIKNEGISFYLDGNNWNLRYACAAIGDISGDGVPEIVVAGYYSHTNTWNLRMARDRTDGDRPMYAIGCYNGSGQTIKDFKTFEAWESGLDMVWMWSEDEGMNTVALTTFKANGNNNPEKVFVDGVVYDYNSNAGFTINTNARSTVYDKNNYGTNKSNRWISEAVAGNFTNDKGGKETVAFIQGMKESGRDNYYFDIYTLIKNSPNTADNSWTATRGYNQADIVGSTSLAAVDVDNDSALIRYRNQRDYYFTDPKIIAVMQAAPHFDGLDALDSGYSSAGGTTFGQSKGSGTSNSQSASVSAGIVTGFEQKVSFMGLVDLFSIELEFGLSASMGYEYQDTNEKTYTVTFNSPSDADRVALTMIPYVRYYYDILIPTYKIMSQGEYNNLVNQINTLKTWLTNNAASHADFESKCAEYLEKEEKRQTVADLLSEGWKHGQVVPAHWDIHTVSYPSEVRTRIITVDDYDAVAAV